MKRINVVGTSGSGKSTLCKALSATLAYPYYEMDALFWQPNWQGTNDELFFEKIHSITSQSCWVLDGNYQRTLAIKWKHVDTVIWVDYSFSRTLFQAIKRALTRSITKQELWPGTGNTESFKLSFMSRKSVLLWTLKTYKSNRLRYIKMMNAEEYAHIQFIRLPSPKSTQVFLDSLKG